MSLEQQREADRELHALESAAHKQLVQKEYRYNMQYIETCIYLLTLAFIANFTVRVFYTVREFLFYKNYYLPNEQFAVILGRTFTYTPGAICLMLGTLIVTLSLFGVTKKMPIMPVSFLAYLPVYWMLAYMGMERSPLDYTTFIRERNGLDYAEGMAANYFHGYLKLTLPSFTDNMGIRERIDQYSAEHNVEFVVKKLVILIPNTLYVSPVIESKHLEKVQNLSCVRKNRAGVKRPYQNDVYRLSNVSSNRFYYVALEGATPLLSYYDAMQFRLTATWQLKEFERDILLKFYTTLKRLITEWPETENAVELIFYASKTVDGRTQDIGDVLWAHFENTPNATNES